MSFSIIVVYLFLSSEYILSIDSHLFYHRQGHMKTELDGKHALKTQLIGGNPIDLIDLIDLPLGFIGNFFVAVDMVIEICDALKSQYFLQRKYFSRSRINHNYIDIKTAA
jgi:hypothetical protein